MERWNGGTGTLLPAWEPCLDLQGTEFLEQFWITNTASRSKSCRWFRTLRLNHLYFFKKLNAAKKWGNILYNLNLVSRISEPSNSNTGQVSFKNRTPAAFPGYRCWTEGSKAEETLAGRVLLKYDQKIPHIFCCFLVPKRWKVAKKMWTKKKTCGVFFFLNRKERPNVAMTLAEWWKFTDLSLGSSEIVTFPTTKPSGSWWLPPPGSFQASRSPLGQRFAGGGLVGRWIFLLGPIFRGYVYIGFGEGKMCFFL